MYQLKHIIVLFLSFLCSAGMYAQVHIGEGLIIGKGANVIISNQDVVINTGEIRGEGNLIIRNSSEQLITVETDFDTDSQIVIEASNINIQGKHAKRFSARHLPKLTNEIKIAAKREEQNDSSNEVVQEDLPVRYINVDGLVFGTNDEEQPKDPIFKSLPDNQTGGVLISEVFQIHAVQLLPDYIIPIYSTLNDARFSDDAKLYEFEGLTAILKPPIC